MVKQLLLPAARGSQGSTLLWTTLAGCALLITALAFITHLVLDRDQDQATDVAAIIAAVEAEQAMPTAESGVHFALDDTTAPEDDPELILEHLSQQAQAFSANHSLPADSRPSPLPEAVRSEAMAAEERRQESEPRVRLGMDIALASDPNGEQHALVISLRNGSAFDLPISGRLLGLAGHNAAGELVWEHDLELDPGMLAQGQQWDWVAVIAADALPPEYMTSMSLRYGSALTAGVPWPPEEDTEHQR